MKKIIEKIMLFNLITFIFGVRVDGEPLSEPTLKTCYSCGLTNYGDWCKEFKVSQSHGRMHVRTFTYRK